MKVETVVVQLERPRGSFRGRVCEGCYVVENGVVTLTDRDGKPALDESAPAGGRAYCRNVRRARPRIA
jgi:hypothetical protein